MNETKNQGILQFFICVTIFLIFLLSNNKVFFNKITFEGISILLMINTLYLDVVYKLFQGIHLENVICMIGFCSKYVLLLVTP